MNHTDFEKDKDRVIEYVRSELIGPIGGEHDPLYDDKPVDRYLMGVLFPREADSSLVLDGEDDSNSASDQEEVDDSPISSLFQRLPASMGVSFYVEGAEIEIHVFGGCYRKLTKKDHEKLEVMDENDRPYGVDADGKWPKWVRDEISGYKSPETVVCNLKRDSSEKVEVLGGRALLHVLPRKIGSGYLVTVSLVNAIEHDQDGGRINSEDCIFQTGIRCRVTDGKIGEYPSVRSLSYDDEEEELALQYSNHVAYAIGHGCSANWKASNGEAEYVETDFMPVSEVKPVTTSVEGDSRVLSLQYLSDQNVPSIELEEKLGCFIDDYEQWFSLVRQVEFGEYAAAGERILGRIENAISRMKSGADLIASDEKTRQAFALANRSMLMQMIHSTDDYAGGKRGRNASPYVKPNYDSNENENKYKWRPFQLAFQLLVLPSLVEVDRDDRDVVDLLWFPTGGGKTEAYLSLAAFEMLYRRIVFGDEGLGTAVLKRYTLRLLTTQQFQRASTLICALEALRKSDLELLGEEPFRLGLWVGQASTPNHYTNTSPNSKGALELYRDLLEQDRPENPFQLQKCPWCGTEIVPQRFSDDMKDYGVVATESTFKFLCPSDDCEFHHSIPVTVVDDDIYSNPPTFVIGTVDKFARLAWDDSSSNMFGTERRRPPSLIIQDEMHLISGPLGTIAGIYEAAIDTLIESKGITPKIIAATATVRRAGDQVQKLYAGEVQIFPPPGVRANDSYFSRESEEEQGRFYIGLMGQGHSPVTSVVRTAAVLSQSVYEVDISDTARDSWWTQVIYHNSRRELGKTMTLASDDIPARVEIIASAQDRKRMSPVNVEELSSNIKGTEIPRVLEDLELTCESGNAIDLLPCTNMISVGVDVSRLGMMLVVGQPKSTSEYIQASSRVGRNRSRPSGLVFTLYSPSKPRDRSHYESFVHYHSALYRYVEPTSVTPFAEPARKRALHAAVVIVARHACGLGANDAACSFDRNDSLTRENMQRLLERMVSADSSEREGIERDMELVLSQWEEVIGSGGTLRYEARAGRQFRGLLAKFDDPGSGEWKTLNSMRNVDSEVEIHVRGAPDE